MDDFKKRFQQFAEERGRSEDKIADLLKLLASSEVLVLPDILTSDLASLKTKFKDDSEFLLGFIRSLRLDEAVLGAIGVTNPNTMEKKINSEYKTVGSLFDISDNEDSIKKGLDIDRPASATLWKFVERFTRPATLPMATTGMF